MKFDMGEELTLPLLNGEMVQKAREMLGQTFVFDIFGHEVEYVVTDVNTWSGDLATGASMKLRLVKYS